MPSALLAIIPLSMAINRAAFGALIVFLGLNDIDFMVAPESATAMNLALAAGEVDEEGLTRWIRDNWPAEAR